ncbi:MAG: UDP-3-O-(3-hydroxymyristoyl)glucosamine N-acyltransferase [Hyphomonas sp.]
MPVDTRFYAPLGGVSLEKIEELTGLKLEQSNGVQISNIAAPTNGRRGDISFLDGDGKKRPEISPDLTALIVTESNREHVPGGIAFFVSKTPRYHHSLVAKALFDIRHQKMSGNQLVAADAEVDPSAIVGPGAVVGAGAVIGAGSHIGANAVIGPGVQVGRNCRIGAGASVFCALIGNAVTLLAGASIGETGFGVMMGPDGAEDAPHYGRVILQDGVTVGANTCIDRGVFDDTILGERTKIDNLCQIAHNVVFGRGVVMAAFGGISGSVRVGDYCQLGGRVGIADHVVVGENVSLAASSGLFRDIPDGEVWGGTPAKPLKQWMREIAWVQKQAAARKTST